MLLSYCDFDVGDLVLWKKKILTSYALQEREEIIYGIVVEAANHHSSPFQISIQFVGWSSPRDFGKYDYSELDNMEIVQKA